MYYLFRSSTSSNTILPFLSVDCFTIALPGMLFKRIFSAKGSAVVGAASLAGNVFPPESSNDRSMQLGSRGVSSSVFRNTIDIKDPDGDYIIVDDKKYHLPNYPPIVVQDVEFEACLDTLRSDPQMLEQFLPSESTPSDIVGFRQDIKTILYDSATIERVQNKIANHNRSVMAVKENEMSASDQWDSLRKKYPCALCQDVLAAPVIFKCSHNFCGACADSLFESCVACDDYLTVGHPCPHCREELENPSYERLLDENILNEVEKVPSCEMKTWYEERRQQYFQQKKERETAAKQKKINPIEFLGRYTGRDEQSSVNETDTNDEQREAYWEAMKEWSIPHIAFVLLAISMIVRYSSKK